MIIKTFNSFFFTALSILLISTTVTAQDEATTEAGTPEETDGWSMAWRANLNGTQAAYSNWSQGGVSSMSVIAGSALTAKRVWNRYEVSSNLNMKYGQTRRASEDFRKSEDQIRWRNQFLRRFDDPRWGLVFNVNLETQFDVARDEDTDEVHSRFFSPAYITEMAGVSYRPDEYFRAEAGASMKQTIVTDEALRPQLGLDPDQAVQNEYGFSIILQYERQIIPNVIYSGYLETFSNVERSLLRSDFYFTNELTGRITENISANFEIAFQYNEDFIDEIQVKQILSVGINYTFM